MVWVGGEVGCGWGGGGGCCVCYVGGGGLNFGVEGGEPPVSPQPSHMCALNKFKHFIMQNRSCLCL